MQIIPSISIKNLKFKKSKYRVASIRFKTTSQRLLNVGKVNTCHTKTLTQIISKLNLRFQSLHLTCIHSNGIRVMKIILISVVHCLEIGFKKELRRMLFRKVQILRLKESSKTLLQTQILKV